MRLYNGVGPTTGRGAGMVNTGSGRVAGQIHQLCSCVVQLPGPVHTVASIMRCMAVCRRPVTHGSPHALYGCM